jgi:hypothetical protein
MKTLFQILILLATTVALVSSQGTKIKDFPLSVASSVSCDTIVTQSSFGGDCCALNRTDGGGCVLNVINGYCKVSSLVTIELYFDAIYTCHRTIQYIALRCVAMTRRGPHNKDILYSPYLLSTIFFSHRFEDKLGLWTILPCLTVVVPSVLLRNCPWEIFFLLLPLASLHRRELAFTCRVLSCWGSFQWSQQQPWPS